MTRGKYAAKANGQRAEAAQNTAVQLRMQIDEMRREHAAEMAALKAQVDQLNGKLVSEVGRLAAAEVQATKAAADLRVEAIRAEWKERLGLACRILDEVGLPTHAWAEFWSILGLTPVDTHADRLATVGRGARRQSVGDLRKGAKRLRQEVES